MKGSWMTPTEGADPTVDHGVDLGAPGAVLLGRGPCGLLGPSWASFRPAVQPDLASHHPVTGRMVALLEKPSFSVAAGQWALSPGLEGLSWVGFLLPARCPGPWLGTHSLPGWWPGAGQVGTAQGRKETGVYLSSPSKEKGWLAGT